MPPVIIAAGAAAAYGGVVSWVGATALGYALGAVAAFGVNAVGRAVFGLNKRTATDPLEDPGMMLTNTPSNTAPIPVVYGARRMGGTIVFAEVTGEENEFLNVVYAIAEGEVHSIGRMYLDGQPVPELVESSWPTVELTGPAVGWTAVSVKVLEEFSGTYTYSGTWDEIQAAVASYPGTVTLSRGPGSDSEGGAVYPLEGSQYNLVIRPYDSRTWPEEEAGQVGLSSIGDSVYAAVDVTTEPTEENGYTLGVRVENRHDSGDPVTALVYGTLYTAGESQFRNRVEVHRHVGTDDQVADANLLSRSESWTAEHRLAGVAYVYARYRYNQDAFPGGIPTATWDVQGCKVYDPRDESTGWSENPALCILDYLTNARYGRGADLEAVDIDAIITAANYCDQLVEDGAKRWTCNGAVQTDRTALQNMEALLSSCRGWLVFAGGKYSLFLDAPATPVMTLTEDDITGAWSFQLGDKRTTANRVEAKFFDPEQDYQAGYAPADSEGLRALDRGLLLEQEITLEFTNSYSEAYRQAAIELNQSRQGLSVQFAAMPRTLSLVSGDVFRITHWRPGWVEKKFRVLTMRLRQAGDIEMTVKEYADEVYDYGNIPVQDVAPNTNLPSPLSVDPPGPLAASEELYSTRAAAGVKVRVLASWTASPDAYVADYLLEARGPADVSWRPVSRTSGLEAEVLDVAPGLWSFRALAINSLGVRSSWTEILDFQVQGLLAPPATPAGLSLTAHSYLALLTWEPHQDLDVRAGGSFRVKHAPAAVASPTWDDAQDIGQAVAGSANQVVLPLLAGTYFIKAVDSSGIESLTPASVETDAPGLWNLVQVGTWTPVPAWSGTHTDTEVDGGALRLVESGGEVTALIGDWVSTTTLALTQEQSVQLRAELQGAAYAVQDQFDSRTDLIDTWQDFDGAVNGAATAEVWVSVYDSGTTSWRPWQRLTIGDFFGQVFRFKVVLRSTGPAFNVAVTGLTVSAQEVSL